MVNAPHYGNPPYTKNNIILGFSCGAAIGPNNLTYSPPANSVLLQMMDWKSAARMMHSHRGFNGIECGPQKKKTG